MGTGEKLGVAQRAHRQQTPRRRTVVKSEPVAATTQEAVDGYCEKVMIASVEQIELGPMDSVCLRTASIEWMECAKEVRAPPKLAPSMPHKLRENPIEPVKSAWSAASGSGQQRVKRSAIDAEPEAQIGVPMEMGTDESAVLPSALATNTRRRIAEKSNPVATTTQGVDGYREKAKKIASGASRGHVLKLAEDKIRRVVRMESKLVKSWKISEFQK